MRSNTINRQYEILQEIGRGRQATVYLARNLQRPKRPACALKLLHRLEGRAACERLRTEFLRLKQIRHPNLTPVFDLDVIRTTNGDLPSRGIFFTARYVEGAPPKQRFSELTGKDPKVRFLWKLLVDTASVLDTLHRHQVLHRDIKPNNIIQDETDKIWILDLGLSSAAADPLTTAGTIAFMAPEVLRGIADARADLYSLGATVFDLVAGHPPCGPLQASLPQAVEQLLSKSSPPRLDEIAPWIPADLAETVARLVAPRIEDRYPAAAVLLEDLDRRKEIGLQAVPVSTTLETPLLHSSLCGRKSTTKALRMDLERFFARQGAGPHLSLICGPAGSGRDRVLEDLVQAAQLQAAAHPAETSMCFIDGWDGLRRLVTAHEPLEQSARGTLPDASTVGPEALWHRLALRLEALSADLPVLIALPDGDHPAVLDFLRYLGRAPAVELSGLLIAAKMLPEPAAELARLGTHVTVHPLSPLERQDMAHLLESMLALQPCAPFVTKMMRASQGLPGVAVELLRTAWAQCRQRHKVVDCDPLALTGKGLRDIYRPRIKLLAPAARALLRYLSLWRRPCRLSWLFEMTDLQPDAGWAATETLLALGLIHLHDDRVALTQAAVGQAALKGIARKQRMRWKHIAVDVARRHLPEPLERVLQEPTACEHRDALVAMADVVASNPAESISSYADGPQILERAGEICLQDLQTDRSAALFHRAGQALARGDLALRPHAVDLMSRTVELWTQCGRYTRALQTIDEALGDLNPDEAQKSRLIYLQARVFQRQGNYEKAADLLTATSARGDVLTDHQRALLARVLLTQGNLKSAAELTATVSKQSDRPVAVELLETAGLVCFYAHRFKEARSLYERAQAQAAATRRPAFVARQLNLLGMIEHQSGRLDNAGSLYGRATEIAARCGDIHGLALYESNAGAVMWERGDFGSALDSLTQGVRDLLRLGKTAEWIGALLNLANTLLRLGDYTNAARKARSALEGAKRIGARPEHYKAMLLLADSGSWLRLSISLGRNDAVATSLDRRLQKAAAALKRIWPPNGDPIRLTQRAVAGFTALERKTELLFARAAHVIAVVAHEAWSPDLADQITALTNAVADPECDLMARLESLHALCLAFFNGPTSDALPTREWFDRHLDDSLTALQSTQLREWKWRLGYCAARMAALSGDLQRSSRHARNAHQILHTLLAETPQFHRAQRAADPEARLLQEFVETPASWRAEMSNADADLSPAAPLIPAAEIYRPGERSATHPSNGRQRPSSGAPASRREHRLRRLLAINKRLNSEHRLEPLLDQILDSVIDLTEAERGFLLLVEADQLRVVAARNMDKEGLERGQDARSRWSRSIAQRALESTEPILTVDAAEDERFSAASSVMDMQLRSVLTVPLLVKGKAVGTIYVDNRLRKGAFDESDAELALDFADQAALAIENARLVSENEARHQRIRQLNEQLQNRLDEQEATMHDIRAELISSRQALEMRYDYSNIVGSSPAMVKTFQLLDRITETDLPVVVQGESGTGKELVARAIHFNGARKKGAFVSENCGAVPDTLLESILFGHEKGAFTGANRQQRGLFEIADGGTLFLDEVGDMSLAMQVKLLRALQDGEFRRVGGDHVIKVDVRVVAASNRSLAKLVEDGTFRKDLYYRLNVVTITLPPLRQRTEDIPLLVAHFLKKHGPAGKALRIGPEALSRLQSFGWPGNVRQLENEIMRAAALCGDTIRLSDLSPEVLGTQIQPTDLDPDDLDLKKRVARLEKVLIQQALDRTDGNRTQAAKILGVSRYGLIKKLDRLGID